MKSKLFEKENWNNSLALYVIDYWLDSQISQLPKWSDFLNLFGFEESNNLQLQLLNFLEIGELANGLIVELEAKVEEIKKDKDIDSIEKITEVEEELLTWYYGNFENKVDGCTSRLGVEFRQLRRELRDKYQHFLNSFWVKTSPRPCLKYLAEAEAFILNIIPEYKLERQSCKAKENAGRKSCERLYSKSFKAETKVAKKEDYQSIINLLSHIYKCKIKVNILTLAIEILEAIVGDNELYVNELIKSVSFLRKVKKAIEIDEEKQNKFIIELAQEKSIIHPQEISKELEIRFGSSINRWGNYSYISEIEVKEKILEKVTIVSNDIYQELKQEFTPTVSSSSGLQLVKSN